MTDMADRLATHSDSLVEEKRIAKRPLIPWTETLIDQLDVAGNALDSEGFAIVQNNLGLILLHSRGHAAAAENCSRQIEWAAELRRADLLLQPLVNLARIDRITGDTAAAHAKLAIIRDAGLGLPVSFEGHDLTGLDAQTRRFASTVSLIERFHLVLPTDVATIGAYFASPDYIDAALDGGSIFAEQKLQAGLIHDCPNIFQAGLAMIRRPTASFAAIVAHYYATLWHLDIAGDKSRVDKLADGMIKISSVVSRSESTIDHRFLRLLFATGRVSENAGIPQHSVLYRNGLKLAKGLDDIHFALLAKHRLGCSDRKVSEEMAAAGYRSLRGITLSANPLPCATGLDAILDDLLLRVEKQRNMASHSQKTFASLATAA